MNELNLAKPFHITVATSPANTSNSGQINLEPEIRLLKAALLYADKVKFCSLSSSFLLTMLVGIVNLNDNDVWEMVKRIGNNPTIERYLALKNKKRPTKQELLEYQRLKSHLEPLLPSAKEQLQQNVEKLLLEAGINPIITAIQSGFVEIQTFSGAKTDELVNEFYDIVGNAVLAKETYPLFDDATGDLINYAFKEGKLTPTKLSENKTKHVSLSSNFLSRLPLFDDASIDEIIDIRRELDRSLVKFRSSMGQFSQEMNSPIGNKEFSVEADEIFRLYVEPAIIEIEEEFKQRRPLRDFALKMSKVGVPSTIGVLIGKLSQMPDIANLALGLGIGVVGSAITIVEMKKEWEEKISQVERNQLYFYYRAGQELTKRK